MGGTGRMAGTAQERQRPAVSGSERLSVSSRREWGPAASEIKLVRVQNAIVSCDRCSRLRSYCQEIAREKRRAFRDETYWARPVPGFGDPTARVLIVGLAPPAHGANRTGRVFTGDGAGASGDFLMTALHSAGFANLTTSQRPD